MNPRVLCLLIPGFEEIETVAPVDLLRRAGAEVVLASVTGDTLVRGRSDLVLQADAPLAEVAGQEFDLLLIPGGPGVKLLRADGRPARLAREFVDQGKPVGAICAAPLVLLDAGLLAGRRYTAHSSVWTDLPECVRHEVVVEHGPLITSQGAGTAVTFGLALVQRLFGMPKADEVARAIML
ncbi:MAG: DJ-1/PfpI family protein [Planctomycetes bacterium]|nr:DJ-1/PfpI family protein [Planctomycetota bacterium]